MLGSCPPPAAAAPALSMSRPGAVTDTAVSIPQLPVRRGGYFTHFSYVDILMIQGIHNKVYTSTIHIYVQRQIYFIINRPINCRKVAENQGSLIG